MYQPRTHLIFFGSLWVFLSACAGFSKPSNIVSFYSLEYAPQPITDPQPLPLVLRVERFTASPIYDNEHMIYSDKPFKKEAYYYYEWRAKPAEMVTFF